MGCGPEPGSATLVSKHWTRPLRPLHFLLDKHKENSRLPFLRTSGWGEEWRRQADTGGLPLPPPCWVGSEPTRRLHSEHLHTERTAREPPERKTVRQLEDATLRSGRAAVTRPLIDHLITQALPLQFPGPTSAPTLEH